VKVRQSADKGKKMLTTPYHDNTWYSGMTDYIEVQGPWQERNLKIETKDPWMHVHLYSGNCPYQGFWMGMTVGNESLTRTTFMLTVEFK
jgi:hypothetical protein